MEQSKLNETLEKHKKWLNNESSGERADLSDANLRCADLSYADLSGADLSYADLSGADLCDADLSGTNLSGTNLSGTVGLESAIDYIKNNFELTPEGVIAYKTFGSQYKKPDTWEIEAGSVISENVNTNRTDICGCGINVAPLDWVKKSYNGDIWKVLIKWEWLPGVVVPYNTDGKIRCERVQLINIVER